jgi:uncharacterized protein (TIGR01777 family)
MKVVVLGASGFVGRHLSTALAARGDDVVAASLRDVDAAARACEGADAVVNLSGESIAQRWTTEVKQRIRSSRVDAPRALVDRLRKSTSPPKVYVTASAIGYYGTSESATFVEASPPGDDFLARVCVDWEAEAMRAADFGARVTRVRNGLVLGTDGGALAKIMPLFRVGAGGVVASGRQWYSWIHLDDAVAIYLDAVDRLDGPVNAVAPNPVRNGDFTTALAHAVHRPALARVPEFALRLILGDGAVVATQGQRVIPERVLAFGYRFKFTEIGSALSDLSAKA